MPAHEYTYDPTQPGSNLDHRAATILARPHKPLPGETTVEMVEKMMARKRADTATNEAALLAELEKHQLVIERFDALIESVEAVADTTELEDLMRELRARREQADRLLFSGNKRQL